MSRYKVSVHQSHSVSWKIITMSEKCKKYIYIVIETNAGKIVEKPRRSENTYYHHCWCLGKWTGSVGRIRRKPSLQLRPSGKTQKAFAMTPESSSRKPDEPILWYQKVPLVNQTGFFYDTRKFHSQTQRTSYMMPKSSIRKPNQNFLWYRKVLLANPANLFYDTGKFHS